MASSLLDINALHALQDINDVSKRLHIAKQTLYTWHMKGIGPPAVKIGNRIRYRPEAVEAWLAAQESEQAQ